MTDAPTPTPIKRRPGRPTKAEAAAAAKPKYKMKAKANWEDLDDLPAEESVDRLHIDRDVIPEGMDMQWVTDTVLGQPQPQHRSGFERRGWTPVHQEDFDGQFDGMWMPKGASGEIKNEGLVLMARPLELSIKARRADMRAADERVQIKERALRGGHIPGVSLDSTHPNAVSSNRITRSMDGAFVPMPKD